LAVGSGEILETLGVHYGLAKQVVVRGDPGYLQLSAAAKAVGGREVAVPLNARLEHDLDAMAAAVGPDTGCVYLANPNNPTGTVVPSAQIRDFVRKVGPKTLVVVDEAYLDIADDYAGRTVIDLVRKGENVIVLRTFSKIYGLAGIRVGYGIGAPKLISLLRSYGGGSLSYLGVMAALASLKDPDYVATARAKIVGERAQLLTAMKEVGLRYAEPQGNFVFFQTGRPYPEVAAKFRAAEVAIARPFPPLTDWVRISIGLPEENALARATLRTVFARG
jgi:histidinol-phosphate aminotransferase